MVLTRDDGAETRGGSPADPPDPPDPRDEPFPNEPTIDQPMLDVPVEQDTPAEPEVVRDPGARPSPRQV